MTCITQSVTPFNSFLVVDASNMVDSSVRICLSGCLFLPLDALITVIIVLQGPCQSDSGKRITLLIEMGFPVVFQENIVKEEMIFLAEVSSNCQELLLIWRLAGSERSTIKLFVEPTRIIPCPWQWRKAKCFRVWFRVREVRKKRAFCHKRKAVK